MIQVVEQNLVLFAADFEIQILSMFLIKVGFIISATGIYCKQFYLRILINRKAYDVALKLIGRLEPIKAIFLTN